MTPTGSIRAKKQRVKKAPTLPARHFPTILITAVCSSIFTGLAGLCIATYQSSRTRNIGLEQHMLLQNSQLHASRVGYVEMLSRLLSDYRTAAFTYFLAELTPKGEGGKTNVEEKQAAYYRLKAELNSALIIVPFYFTKESEPWMEQLRTYLGKYSWADIILGDEFASNLAGLEDKDDSTTQAISRWILLEEFDHLATQVIASLALDIAKELEGRAELKEQWARRAGDRTIIIEGACTVDRSTARVGEIVTFEAAGSKGPGFFSYKWDGDHDLKSRDRKVNVRYHEPGTKVANVCIFPVRLAGQFEQLFENRIYSQCKVRFSPQTNDH